MQLPGHEIIAPQSLIDSHQQMESFIQSDIVRCVQIHLTNQTRRGEGLFTQFSYGELTNRVHELRDHLNTTRTLCMFIWGREVDLAVNQLKDVLHDSETRNPFGPWFHPHPTKPFLQKGRYISELSKQPVCSTRKKLSFKDPAEYMVHIGYSMINEFEHELRENNREKPYPCQAKVLPMRGSEGNASYVLYASEQDKDLSRLTDGDSIQKQFTREVAASAKLIYRDDLMPSLLATNSLALPKVDLFRTVRRKDKPEVQKFKESLKGNLQQTKIVECLSSLPGRIVAIGPAGSGKTVIAIHGIVLPLSYFARDSETPSLWKKDAFTDAPKTGKARHQVILLAPQNPVCDNLAMKADEVLMDHAEEQLTRRANGKPPLVIRLEGTFVRKDLPKVPKGPRIFDDENPDFVDIATDTISFRQLTEFDALDRKWKGAGGMRDHRFQCEKLSLGYRVMEFVGFIESPWSAPTDWQLFRNKFLDLKCGVATNSEDWKIFQELLQEVISHVLDQADVVVCTPFMASHSPCLRFFILT
jgi:hypothetical protein